MSKLTDEELKAIKAVSPTEDQCAWRFDLRRLFAHIEAITEELQKVEAKSEERKATIIWMSGSADFDFRTGQVGKHWAEIRDKVLSDDVPEHAHRWGIKARLTPDRKWRTAPESPLFGGYQAYDVFCADCGVTADKVEMR